MKMLDIRMIMFFLFAAGVEAYLIWKIIKGFQKKVQEIKKTARYVGAAPYTKKCIPCNVMHSNEWKVCFYCSRSLAKK